MEAITTHATQTPPGVLSLVFYFDRRGRPLQYSTHGMFRSFLHQILSQDEALLSTFCQEIGFEKRIRELGQPGEKWDWSEIDLGSHLMRYCQEYSKQHKKVRLLIDALDEIGEDNARELLQWFEQLFAQAPDQIAICVSCRPYPRLSPSWTCMMMEQINGRAIEAYVRAHIGKGLSVKAKIDTERVISDILDRARGVFQWIVLIIRRVQSLESESVESILADIRRTSVELDGIYRQMLMQLSASDKELAYPVFCWITLAARPLSLTELRTAKGRCTVDTTGKTIVEFDHESVRDFMHRSGLQLLEGTGEAEPGRDAIGRRHSALAATCVQFLAARNAIDAELDADETGSIKGGPQALGDAVGFLEYATHHWMIHARQAEIAGISQTHLITLSNWPENATWAQWDRLWDLRRLGWVRKESYTRATLQHVAARYGLLSIILDLIPKIKKQGTLKVQLSRWRWQPDGILMMDDHLHTPIAWAAGGGHYEIVRALLEFSKFSADRFDNPPLVRAAWGGHTDVVNLLLSAHKVNMHRNGPAHVDALLAAALNGHDSIVKLLLQTGKVDVNAAGMLLWTPLHRAAEYGRTSVVKILLNEAKLKINAVNSDGQTALDLAREGGHVEIEELLIMSGATIGR
ncbi:hypothetical protein BST61_g7682 [Cercospora zeina]